MNSHDFNQAILRAEAILSDKGFFKPTEDLKNFDEFTLNYQPVKVMPGFYTKKMERATATGEKITFEIYVNNMGGKVFLEIFQRISNTLS